MRHAGGDDFKGEIVVISTYFTGRHVRLLFVRDHAVAAHRS
jgi:hypothetical protein